MSNAPVLSTPIAQQTLTEDQARLFHALTNSRFDVQTSVSTDFGFVAAAPNGTPTASDDGYFLNFGHGAEGNVLDNDVDVDGDALTVTGVTGANGAGAVGQALAGQYGTLTLLADGSFTYTPTAWPGNARAKDVFTYTIDDGHGGTATTDLTFVKGPGLVSPGPTLDRIDPEWNSPAADPVDDHSTDDTLLFNAATPQACTWHPDGEATRGVYDDGVASGAWSAPDMRGADADQIVWHDAFIGQASAGLFG